MAPQHQIKLNGVSCLWKFSNYHPFFTGLKDLASHETMYGDIEPCLGLLLWAAA